MCKCNPKIRTPYCGKMGCTWPENPNDIRGAEKLEIVKVSRENIMEKLEAIEEAVMLKLPDGRYMVARPFDEKTQK